ncbi:DUF1697 domain-containing protein [Candidatus Saccharibacteria bacterium]|nr:DUF1697 domain-containing protein [Candidatus Saccharibacteria bacterium]
MKYVALLRGVNVGGKNRVPNHDFKQVLKGLGLRDVTIYINSGNAVFTSDSAVSSSTVQSAMESHFGFAIPTLVVPGDKIQAIAAAIPPSWTNDPPKPDKSGQKSDVLYLFDDINTPDTLATIGHKPEIETMVYIDGAIIVNISRANQSRGTLLKIAGSALYKSMTIRNIKTAKKLAELVSE